MKELIPELLPAAVAFYLDSLTLYVYDMDNPLNDPASLLSASGQQQGDTLGSILFCLGIQPILIRVREKYPGVLIRAITNDIHLAGPPGDTTAAFIMLRDELAAMHLHLKYSPVKTCAWSPSFEPVSEIDVPAAELRRAACPLLALNPPVPRNRGGIRTLGSAIGTDHFVSTLANYITDLSDHKSVASACSAVVKLAQSDARGARDVAGSIIRSCVVHKASYLTRTTAPPLIQAAAARADVCIRSAFCSVFDINENIFAPGASPAEHLAAVRVHLPSNNTGCGMRSSSSTSHAAHLAAWRSTGPRIRAAALPSTAALLDSFSQPGRPLPAVLGSLITGNDQYSTQLANEGDASSLYVRDLIQPSAFFTTVLPETRDLQADLTSVAERAALEHAVAPLAAASDNAALAHQQLRRPLAGRASPAFRRQRLPAADRPRVHRAHTTLPPAPPLLPQRYRRQEEPRRVWWQELEDDHHRPARRLLPRRLQRAGRLRLGRPPQLTQGRHPRPWPSCWARCRRREGETRPRGRHREQLPPRRRQDPGRPRL